MVAPFATLRWKGPTRDRAAHLLLAESARSRTSVRGGRIGELLDSSRAFWLDLP